MLCKTEGTSLRKSKISLKEMYGEIELNQTYYVTAQCIKSFNFIEQILKGENSNNL